MKALLKRNDDCCEMKYMIEITKKAELEKNLVSKEKSVVLFYSSWCPFCRRFLTTFKKSSENKKLQFLLARIDDDENPIWEEFSIEAVPTIIYFTKNKVVQRMDGQLGLGLNEKQAMKWLDNLVDT